VTFPISDLAGRVVAFGGRALDKDAPAKYLDSPETPLFRKGAMLYNGAAARKAAQQGAQNGVPVIAVEGYVDVIAMVTAGYAATVAPLGTALTEEQLALLWRMADEPILCFDGDAAGHRAAYRAIDLILPCRSSSPARASVSRRCRKATIRTISCARAAPTQSPTCWRAPARSPTCCGRGKPNPAASIRPSGAPALKRASMR
jgi:DNA primase catalytic core